MRTFDKELTAKGKIGKQNNDLYDTEIRIRLSHRLLTRQVQFLSIFFSYGCFVWYKWRNKKEKEGSKLSETSRAAHSKVNLGNIY